jgi:hypothetical protein
MPKMEIDFETADRIVVIRLKDCKKYLKKELKAYKSGEYLHAEDVGHNIKLIESIDTLLKYFGE